MVMRYPCSEYRVTVPGVKKVMVAITKRATGQSHAQSYTIHSPPVQGKYHAGLCGTDPISMSIRQLGRRPAWSIGRPGAVQGDKATGSALFGY